MDGVIEDCDALLATPSADAAALWSTRGRALGRLGRNAEGAADVARALDVSPDDPQLLVDWISLAARAGDVKGARDAYLRLLATDCAASDRELARAHVSYAEGDWPDALASAREIVAGDRHSCGTARHRARAAFRRRLRRGTAHAGRRDRRCGGRAEAQRELDFWRGRHPQAVPQAAADAFAAALRGG
jgi:tetratricopeptide (TPR) repeat protein